jgi:hypothetical protein
MTSVKMSSRCVTLNYLEYIFQLNTSIYYMHNLTTINRCVWLKWHILSNLERQSKHVACHYFLNYLLICIFCTKFCVRISSYVPSLNGPIYVYKFQLRMRLDTRLYLHVTSTRFYSRCQNTESWQMVTEL